MKNSNIQNKFLKNKRINIIVLIIVIIGITLGAIFSNIISTNDRNQVIISIKNFITNINVENINAIVSLKNSLGINLLYIILIWILGLSLIGIIINIFILFIKSFIIGFSLSSFILTYKYKGIILSFIYLIFGQLLNLIVLIVLTINSIIISIKLIKTIISKTNDFGKSIKLYLILLTFSIIASIISSLSETLLMPTLIKLIVKLFI